MLLLAVPCSTHGTAMLCYARARATGNTHTRDVERLWIQTKNCETSWGNSAEERLEDIADKLLALFRQPEWWEEEFEQQFVARGSIGALQDADTCEAVKRLSVPSSRGRNTRNVSSCSWILHGLARPSSPVRRAPEETAAARKLAALLLQDLRHTYGMPPATPGSS